MAQGYALLRPRTCGSQEIGISHTKCTAMNIY